jgi:hypothetical protein
VFLCHKSNNTYIPTFGEINTNRLSPFPVVNCNGCLVVRTVSFTIMTRAKYRTTGGQLWYRLGEQKCLIINSTLTPEKNTVGGQVRTQTNPLFLCYAQRNGTGDKRATTATQLGVWRQYLKAYSVRMWTELPNSFEVLIYLTFIIRSAYNWALYDPSI